MCRTLGLNRYTKSMMARTCAVKKYKICILGYVIREMSSKYSQFE